MNRCKTCKHWVENTKDEWNRQGWGKCSLASSSDGQARNPKTLAVAQDCEGYGANLDTAENFGCVQHTAR